MGLFKHDKLYDVLKFSKPFLVLSALFVTFSILLTLFKGLTFGIDFTGGTLIQLKYTHDAPIGHIREILGTTPYNKSSIQEFGSPDEIIIKIPTTTSSLETDIGDEIRAILAPTGAFEIRRVDIVGPKVGGELREKGLTALLLALAGVLLYVSFRFEWRFAVASVVALAHDIAITVGLIALLKIDVNLDILAALLTILGYSINDTIVVFDRIRETLQRSKANDLIQVINEAISRTLSRTTLTSLTTFFVVLTLYLFGGELISGLSFTLLVGVIVGTYSSIFVAAALLKLFGFRVDEYRSKEAKKAAARAEKDRIRAQYERGTL
jgi:preprotein translocase subunit SecF